MLNNVFKIMDSIWAYNKGNVWIKLNLYLLDKIYRFQVSANALQKLGQHCEYVLHAVIFRP